VDQLNSCCPCWITLSIRPLCCLFLAIMCRGGRVKIVHGSLILLLLIYVVLGMSCHSWNKLCPVLGIQWALTVWASSFPFMVTSSNATYRVISWWIHNELLFFNELLFLYLLTCLMQVCERIIESGRALSRSQRSSSPLMYEWHDKKYLGAAHGLVGILHTLLMARTSQ